MLEMLPTLLGAAVRRAERGPLRPGWSFRAEMTLALLDGLFERSKTRGIPWLRAAQQSLPVPRTLESQVRRRRVEADGVPMTATEPVAGVDARHLLYIHGGGYTIGSAEMVGDLTAALAIGARATVWAPDYRLAPEHPYPAALDDCLACVRWLRGEGVAPASLAIAGDSAGGALATASLVALRDAGEPLPAAGALICPWSDPFAEGGSVVANEPFDYLDRELAFAWGDAYVAGQGRDLPLVRLLQADLSGLPPLLLQAGEVEILVDQVKALASRARDAGVDTTLRVYPEMFHDFQLLGAVLPEAREAVAEIARFLRDRVPAPAA